MKDGKADDRAYLIIQEALLEFGKTQRDGTGLSGLTESGYLYHFKSDATAGEYFFRKDWEKNRMNFYHTPVMLGHVRLACSGQVNPPSAHPFRGVYRGHNVDLIHNGWLNNEAKLIEWLKEKGHKIETNVDSELILHTLEEVGFDDVPLKFSEMAVTGKVNYMALFDDGTLKVYSHGDIEMYEDDEKVVVATERFRFPGDGDIKADKWHKVDSGTIITITPSCEVLTKVVENVERVAHVKGGWSKNTTYYWNGKGFYPKCEPKPKNVINSFKDSPTFTYLPKVGLWTNGHVIYDEGLMVLCSLSEYPEAQKEYNAILDQEAKLEEDCEKFDALLDKMDKFITPELETLVSKNLIELFREDMRSLSDEAETPLFPKGQNTKKRHREMFLHTYKVTSDIYEMLWERYSYLRPVSDTTREKALEFVHKLNPPSKWKKRKRR